MSFLLHCNEIKGINLEYIKRNKLDSKLYERKVILEIK